jgi:RNA-directed DNA polymerase
MVAKSVGLTRGVLPGSAKAVGRTTQEGKLMTQQNNEDPAVLQGHRKVSETRKVERSGGGKGVPVNQQAQQCFAFAETAEEPKEKPKGADDIAVGSQNSTAIYAEPKSTNNKTYEASVTMEEVVSHLREAFQKIALNRGAPGPDGKSIAEVRKHLDNLIPELAQNLLEGTYRPGEIRRVWIPKVGGGQRGLGIPNVVDRMVQEAVRRVLEPVYEPTFHGSSHGFRPGRSCHTAINEAVGYVEEGYEWTVDIDLEQFFDRVGHQRLMAQLAKRVNDRRMLVLVSRMLKAKVVMPNGVVVSTAEGVPQGSPLSPLLSNIVLDELDRELAQRGHRFVRYADDCNVYVRSERSGQRVMDSIIRFIERRMRLKVNRKKSAVARTEERHFVGFRIQRDPLEGDVEVLLSKRSKERIDGKIRELTPRNWGGSLRRCILRINEYLLGWMGFFGVCTAKVETTLRGLDAHIRRRLRAIQLKHWKRKRTMALRLIRLGVRRKTAWRTIYSGRRSLWMLSHSPAVDRGLRNAYFAERGLVSLAEHWKTKHTEQIVAPVQGAQLCLALG